MSLLDSAYLPLSRTTGTLLSGITPPDTGITPDTGNTCINPGDTPGAIPGTNTRIDKEPVVKPKPKPKRKDKPVLNWAKQCIIPGVNKNYFFTLPIQKYTEFEKILGKPTLFNPSAGGYAMWDHHALAKTKYSFLHSISVVDHQIYCTKPCEHISFVSIEYLVFIPKDKLVNLINSPISSDFVYDVGENILKVRGMNLFYCLSLLKLIIEYSLGNVRYRKLIRDHAFEYCTSYHYLQNYRNRRDILGYLKHFTHVN